MSDGRVSSLQIVVLAAGRSERLGRHKLLERVHGVSLIRRVVGVLGQVTAQPIVVVSAPRAARVRAELRGLRVKLTPNPNRAEGLATSILLALRQTRYRGATLFIPADLAELEPRDIARLIRRWCGARRRVVARGLERRPAAPLILPRWLYARAQRLSGDVGLRALLAGLPLQQQTLVELRSASRDVDTAGDLELARRRAPRLARTLILTARVRRPETRRPRACAGH